LLNWKAVDKFGRRGRLNDPRVNPPMTQISQTVLDLMTESLIDLMTIMNIRAELLKEHSKEQANKISDYACTSKKTFDELMQCFLDKQYRVAQRAAWSVSIAAQKKPEIIQPYISTLVAQLQNKEVHDAVIRNSVRILQQVEIPEILHGEVMNACFQFIETPATPAAIKAFSLTTLFNLSKLYPEIKPELKLIIEELWDTETAAFKSRGKKILSELNMDSKR